MSAPSPLIESLLYQSEGTAIDFKRKQYPFDKATDEQKSELLKDVLAFANSWRQSDAYIVIGIEAVVGGRHKPVNIDDHFDDAQLQQFINSKTNRPIEMAYEVHRYEGNAIGVIRIARQERPIYATKNYGKVEKGVVYYRLGSSTAIATPDDIARMGREAVPSVSSPIMDLQFADHKTRRELGTAIKLKSVVFARPLQPIPRMEQLQSTLEGFERPTSLHEQVNPEYWREKEAFIRLGGLLRPIALVIQNQSRILAEQVRVEIRGKFSDAHVADELPNEPAYYRFDRIVHFRPFWQQQQSMIAVKSHGEQWSVTIRCGNVQPKSSLWLDEPLYLGSENLEHLELDALVFANNLPEPQKVKLLVDFTIIKKEALTVADL